MEEIEADIHQKLIAFCRALPNHLDSWKLVLKESQSSVKALGNFCEQLRLVEKANCSRVLENFKLIQNELISTILDRIEEELRPIKISSDKLLKYNCDLKNKLDMLENACLELDWDRKSPIITGSPLQPPLAVVLQLGYQFVRFFMKLATSIHSALNVVNVRDEKWIKYIRDAFATDLELHENCPKVYELLALTQYCID